MERRHEEICPSVVLSNDVESAILASPNGKAPGLDGVRNEMMKADIKLTTRLVFGI